MRRGTAVRRATVAAAVVVLAPGVGSASAAPHRAAGVDPELLGTQVTPVGAPVVRRLSDGTVTAYGVIANRTAVPTRITRDFAVAFVDAHGEDLAGVTNGGGRAFAEQTVLAPGQTAVWHASSAGPLPDAVSARVVVPAAIASDTLPDEAFVTSEVTVTPTDNGSEQIHARITSHDPRPQQLVTAHFELEDAAGALVGYDQAVVGNGELAPGATTELLVAHPLLPGEPVADHVGITVDAEPAPSVATALDPVVPVQGRLVAGTVVTVSPKLVRADGSPVAGERLSWQERRPGGAVSEIAHGVTDAGGVARMKVRLRTGTVVQVVYPGDDTTFGSSTGDLVLGVRPALVAQVPDAVTHTIVVRGTLLPARPGARLQLQRLVGARWVRVGGAPLARTGRYRIAAALPAGRQRLRVWAPGAGLVPATATGAVTVLVS
ncbi:MAG TPA: hypothetical protein VHE83_18100 [Mycobacteriales bacterium]|nr:hypothetical protein [Mycobacteriales bacterium]